MSARAREIRAESFLIKYTWRRTIITDDIMAAEHDNWQIAPFSVLLISYP